MRAAAFPTAAGQLLDVTRLRLERALGQRVRYRYVQPRVLREGEAFRIESPCCSRNVDPAGGVIDIALLQPCSSSGSGSGTPRPHGWQLHARDHARAAWVLRHEGAPLDELLDLLCVDADRVFWP